MEIAALAAMLPALLQAAGNIADLISQHHNGVSAVTPDQLSAAKAQTIALMDQARALLPPETT